jgi:hypothetical protein
VKALRVIFPLCPCGRRKSESSDVGGAEATRFVYFDSHSGSPLTASPVETLTVMSLYPKPSSSTSFATEFDILRASHKFLRHDNDLAESHNNTWNDQLAQKYYDNLFREFAVCDLKHYKSGNVRTPPFSVSLITDILRI